MESRKLEPWERYQPQAIDWRAARATVATVLAAIVFMLILGAALYGMLMAKELTQGAGGEVTTRYVRGHKMGICGTFLMSPCMKMLDQVR